MIHYLYEEESDQIMEEVLWRLKATLASTTNVRGNSIMQPIANVLRVGIKWDVEANLKEIFKMG